MTNKVLLYTQPSCPQCKMVKMLLTKKNIPFDMCEDIDLMQSKGINHTPTLEVDGTLLTGKEMIDWINTRG